MSHPCPGGCLILVPNSRLMCPYHWRQVTPTHQTALYATYRARLRRPHDQAALTAHQHAMRAAIADVFAHQPDLPALPSGTCLQCGCTDAHACPAGCAWVNAAHTLCSRCAP